MHFLFRIILGASLVWLICNFFYSLGKKNTVNENENKNKSNSRRKKVESTVIEKETDKAV